MKPHTAKIHDFLVDFTGFLLQKLKCFLITDMCHVQSCDNFLTLVGLNLLVLTGFMEEFIF